MSKETWKPYANTPYMVSNLGRVRRDEKILKERLNPAGYSYANLSYNGKSEQPAVHEMVLDAFKVPRPKNVKNPIVKHKNNEKNDNKLENLEWGSIADNTEEAYDDGLIEGKGADNDKKPSDDSKPADDDDTPSDDSDSDSEQEYKEKSVNIPDGWNVKKSLKKYDDEGNEETENPPEGWRFKK